MVQRAAVAAIALAALAGSAAADRISVPPPETPPVVVKEPLAVAIVIEGDVIKLPGSGGEDDGGMFAALQLGLDSIADAAPPGSLGTLITYYSEPLLLREVGPLSTLHGDALGRPADYETKPLGRNLVGAFTRALDELEAVPHARRAIIVVGDGADNDLDRAPAAMKALKDRARRLGVAIYAILIDVGIGDKMSALHYVSPREHFPAPRVLDVVPSFTSTFRELVADAARDRDPSEPDAATGSAGGGGGMTRWIAWGLLAAGLALAALGATVLLRRRAAVTAGRST